MASGNDLEIQIGASVEGLKKGLKDAGNEVKKFSDQASQFQKLLLLMS